MSSRELATLQLKSLAAENVMLFPITAQIYSAMMESGAIPEGAPYELVGGHIVRKDRSEGEDGIMTVGLGHIFVVKQLARLGPKFESLGCHIQTQQPVSLSEDDVPEPDAAIIRGSEQRYKNLAVSAADISCVIEVSDHSLGYDRGAKLLMYASVGIGCYIIVNLRAQMIEAHTNPTTPPDAAPLYATIRKLKAGDLMSIPTPGGQAVTVAVSDLLPSA